MTQYLDSETDRTPPCGAVNAKTMIDRCDLGEGHVGDHLAASGVNWPAHVVIRLDNGDAERMPRLAQLVAMYDAAKAAKDDAEAALKAISDGIKSEITEAIPGGTDFTVTSRDLRSPLTLQRIVSNRVDTKLLQQMLGDRYRAVTKPSYSWTLKRKA